MRLCTQICSIGLFFWLNSLLSQTLQLRTLVHDVIKRNPSLGALKERVHAAQLKIYRVQILDDPELGAMIHENPFNPRSGIKPKIRFELGQKVPLSNKLSIQGRVAEKSLDVVKGEEITTEQELILQTKRAFFKLLFNDIALAINHNNQAIAQRIINDTLVLYRTGKGVQQDILKARIELQALKDEYLDLKSEKVSMQAIINALLDNPQQSHVESPEKIFHGPLTFSYKKLELLAMKNRPELQSMHAMVQEQYALERLAKANYFPDATFGFRYERQTGDHQSTWGVSVSINVPIWIDKKQRREAEEARALALAKQHDLHSMQLMIQGKIKETLAKLRAVEKQILLYQKNIIPDVEKTLSASQAQYRVGKGDFLFLLDTRRQLYNVQQKYDRLRIEREILLAELERAVGLPLEKIVQPENNGEGLSL